MIWIITAGVIGWLLLFFALVIMTYQNNFIKHLQRELKEVIIILAKEEQS